MDNVITGTTIGAGYFLNKDSKNSRTKEKIEDLFKDSNRIWPNV